jgi:hypothetical protein
MLPVAVWADVDNLEIVTGSPPVVHATRHDDGSKITTRLPVEGKVLKAARGVDGWHLLVEASDGTRALHFADGSRGLVAMPVVELTVGPDDRLWATESRFPFVATALQPERGAGLILRPEVGILDSLRVQARQRDFASWVSLPLVALNRGYIQTIADLANDRRLIVAYTPSGGVLSALTVDAPMGFGVATKEGQRLYGARRTNGLEIIEYHYWWDDAASGVGLADHPPTTQKAEMSSVKRAL